MVIDLGLVFLGFIAIATVLTLHWWGGATSRALARTPAQALGRGDLTLMDQARANWQLAQRAVRQLQHLIDDPMVSCTIERENQVEIVKIINDFYGDHS